MVKVQYRKDTLEIHDDLRFTGFTMRIYKRYNNAYTGKRIRSSAYTFYSYDPIRCSIIFMIVQKTIFSSLSL